jgi:hypothetical protein
MYTSHLLFQSPPTMMQPASAHPKYATAPMDDRDDASSSTEVDESLMGDKEAGGGGWGDLPPSSGRRRRSQLAQAWLSYRWLVDTALLLTILGLVLRGQHLQTTTAAATPSQPLQQPLEIGGDFTGVRSEPFAQQITTFKPDPSYAPTNTSEFFTEEVLDKWNALMPQGLGFVWVNDTHRYHDLPKPIEWPGRTVFTTSVTHHIHCLVSCASRPSLQVRGP